LSNTNESVTIHILQNFLKLNKAHSRGRVAPTAVPERKLAPGQMVGLPSDPGRESHNWSSTLGINTSAARSLEQKLGKGT